jgi:hypothetical protein
MEEVANRLAHGFRHQRALRIELANRLHHLA